MLIRKLREERFVNMPSRSFNPSYSGCWFGSSKFINKFAFCVLFQSFLFWMLIRKCYQLHNICASCRVSILLILDVDSEALIQVFNSSFNYKFQSFLFWMLIRKRHNRAGTEMGRQVSILLILDVDSEEYEFAPVRAGFGGFNTSYSGCWFGSRKYTAKAEKKY